jgi:hypothetical protein
MAIDRRKTVYIDGVEHKYDNLYIGTLEEARAALNDPDGVKFKYLGSKSNWIDASGEYRSINCDACFFTIDYMGIINNIKK